MLILAALLSMVIGWLGGGRLANFERAGLGFLWLPMLAVLLQRFALRWWTLLLSYALLLLFLWFNRRLRTMAALAAAGSLCNLLVIALNGFRMPVSRTAIAALSPQGAADLLALRIPMYAAATPATRLAFLGDVLYVRLPLVGGFASIGDVLLAAGVFCCLMCVMEPPRLRGLWRRGKYQRLL